MAPPFPISPRWANPSNSRHQAELPQDYEAPLHKYGERQPIGADELDKSTHPGQTVPLAPSLATTAWQDLGSLLVGGWIPLLLFLTNPKKKKSTISRFREKNSMKKFPFLLFSILEETWRIQVYKHTPAKNPTPLIKWILFELSEKTTPHQPGNQTILGVKFQAGNYRNFIHIGSFIPNNASMFYNENLSTGTLLLSPCSWMTT